MSVGACAFLRRSCQPSATSGLGIPDNAGDPAPLSTAPRATHTADTRSRPASADAGCNPGKPRPSGTARPSPGTCADNQLPGRDALRRPCRHDSISADESEGDTLFVRKHASAESAKGSNSDGLPMQDCRPQFIRQRTCRRQCHWLLTCEYQENYETRKKALRHNGLLLFLTPSGLSATVSEYHAVANGRDTPDCGHDGSHFGRPNSLI